MIPQQAVIDWRPKGHSVLRSWRDLRGDALRRPLAYPCLLRFYLASLSMLILFVTIYNLLSKPINRLQTDLLALRSGTPPDVFLVGSVTRDCEAVRANTRIVASRPRTIDAFRALVERGGWKLNQVVKRPFSYHVRLVWA